jgi:tetratricopeptide (TPR) repeat protein
VVWLSQYDTIGDKAQEATTLNNIALVYDALGEKQKALNYLNKSLSLSQWVGNRAGEAAALLNIGLVYSSLGEKQKALDYYNQSLPILRTVGDKAQQARILYNIATLKRSQGNLDEALSQIEAAINIIELLKASAPKLVVRNCVLLTLTRGFMYAGAPRVLVSLWSVSDRGTSELMSRFYKKMLQDGTKPAAALRAAQIEMLQDAQWKEPYYWAAFTLQGEWH